MNFFTNVLFIVTMVAMFDGGWGPQRNNAYIILFQTMNDDPDRHQTWPLPLLKLEN
jgi:hypothetical protein